MKLSNNQSFSKSNSHRRLWLSSIITLFIFATSVSAYFLVKNSQDIRKSASDPYQNDCICLYNSTCSAAGMKPCEGSCSPACSAPQICCQPITNDLCTQGERYCVDANRIATCKPDRSGYTVTACATGTQCDSALKACKSVSPSATPTSNPQATCQQNGGTCVYNSSCSAVNLQNLTGTCSTPQICCGAPLANNCTQGNSYCVDANRIAVCKVDQSGYTVTACATGTQCDSTLKACKSVAPLTPTCQDTCYTNSSCSAIGKVPATGTCRYDTSVCCKEASPTTSNCEGTCYTNSSCSAIGKVPATGTCLYSTSVCCKEASTVTKAIGEKCSSDSECESGYCYAISENYMGFNNTGGMPIGLSTIHNQYTCHREPSETLQDIEAAELSGTQMGMGTVAAIAFLAPAIPSIIGLTGGNVALLPTAAYSYATATIATAPAWAQTALSVGTLVTGWAGVLGGQKACATNPYSNACAAYVAGLIIAPGEIMDLENMTKNLVNKAGTSVNNYINQQINQTFDGIDSWGYGYRAVDSEVTNYLFPDKTHIFGDQLYGNVYSPAVEKTSSLAQSYINKGMDPYLAIAQATSDTMPAYWNQTDALGKPINVPAENARSLEELVSCDGAVCRHFAQLSTPVANNMGLDADYNQFLMLVDTPEGQMQAGHAVNLVKNLDGTFGVIDATNPKLTRNNVVDYINNIESLGWHPITDISGAIKGYTFQITH